MSDTVSVSIVVRVTVMCHMEQIKENR